MRNNIQIEFVIKLKKNLKSVFVIIAVLSWSVWKDVTNLGIACLVSRIWLKETHMYTWGCGRSSVESNVKLL